MNAIDLAAHSVGLATGAFLGLAIFHPRAGIFGPVVWHGPRLQRSVALTFDDGPHPVFSQRISEILENHRGRGTFFCVGTLAAKHANVVKQLFAAGHDIQNHTHKHNTSSHLFSARRLSEDLRRCQEVLAGLTGTSPLYYRPAAGVKSPPVHWAAKRTQLSVISWSLSARDGAWPLTAEKALQLADRAKPGDIIALHDGILSGKNCLREKTVEFLPTLLARLREREFRLTTLTELLGSPPS